MEDKSYYIYIMANGWNTTLYIGVTNDLVRRVGQHREKGVDGFTKKYNLTKLVYYEMYRTPYEAIAREKQLKRWSRSKKVALIKKFNPKFDNLFEIITA